MNDSYTIILTGRFNHNKSNTNQNILNVIENPLIKEFIIITNDLDFDNYKKIKNEKIRLVKFSYRDYNSISSDVRTIFIQSDQIIQALKYVKTKYVIRLRSDILIKDLDNIIEEFSKNKEKIHIFPGTPDLIYGGFIYSINDYFFICKVPFLKMLWEIPKPKKVIKCDIKFILFFLFLSRSGYGGEKFFPEQIIFRSYLHNRYNILNNSCIDDLSPFNTYEYEKIFKRDFHSLKNNYFTLPLKLRYKNYSKKNWQYPNNIFLINKYFYPFRYILILIVNFYIGLIKFAFLKKIVFFTKKFLTKIK